MAEKLNIGLVQFDITWEDREANFDRVAGLLEGHTDIDLLVLPEMWPTGFSMQPEKVAEQSPGPALSWMLEHSQKFNLAIAGSIPVKDGGRYYNRFYFVNTDGVIHYYNKRHLFSYGKEDQHYASGVDRSIIDFKGWKIMPIICYDLRFPVWCRNNLDYDLMLVVANWPTARIHHWDALIKGRAIENQSYIAAVNRIGSDGNGLHYSGHSCVVDMNGSHLLSLDDGEAVEIVTIDKTELISHRDQYRFLQDQDPFEIKP